MRSRVASFLAVLAAGSIPAVAVASPQSEIASAFDEDDSFDLHLSVDYRFDFRRSTIKREAAGFPGTDPDGPLPVTKDLVAQSSRHILTPRMSLGLFKDVALSVALPITIGWQRELSLDQRADPCVFPGDPGGGPTCVDRTNSSTIADGILPDTGFDAGDPGGPGFTGSDPTMFRGPSRAGLDQLHLGLAWAAMNEARDPTKPTWKLGAQVRLAVGKPMRFDRQDPGSSTGVGRGVHEIRVFTSVAKHTSWAEPYIEVYWLAPIGTRDDSLFQDLGFGQTSADPQQHAGTRFGFDAIFWRDPAERQAVGIDVRGAIDAAFEGRAYTDIWEMLAYAGDEGSGGPLVLDRDPLQGGVQSLSYPGISNVENYLTLTGGLGIHADLGDKVRFSAGFDVVYEQAHVITYADAGVDSDDPGNLIDGNTAEINPSHVPLIDVIGHRYRVEGGFNARFGITAVALF